MEAWQFLSDNVFPHFQIVTFQAESYKEMIDSWPRRGWHGGRIYDAIHLCCARQASCDRIYTFNVRPFQELAHLICVGSYRFSAQFFLHSTFAPARMKSCIIVLCD
jgi:hypothetical protein